LWRLQLQTPADELVLTIQVCHPPPGTSRWNKIRHRMFCHTTNNWLGRPLVSREVAVNLIGSTSTSTDTGPRIRSQLDENTDQAGPSRDQGI
jgi:Rhodopirellula transposase DDE domain